VELCGTFFCCSWKKNGKIAKISEKSQDYQHQILSAYLYYMLFSQPMDVRGQISSMQRLTANRASVKKALFYLISSSIWFHRVMLYYFNYPLLLHPFQRPALSKGTRNVPIAVIVKGISHVFIYQDIYDLFSGGLRCKASLISDWTRCRGCMLTICCQFTGCFSIPEKHARTHVLNDTCF